MLAEALRDPLLGLLEAVLTLVQPPIVGAASLLDELSTRAPNALIVVAKIVPLSSSNSALTNYNNAVPGVVSAKAAQGKHVILVDPFTGFKSNMLSADGVHPNQSGYDYLGDTFYAGVASYLPK